MVIRINAICDNHPGLKDQSIRVPGHAAAATGSWASPGYYNNDFPIKENSEIKKNEIDENVFPLDEDQKIGDNINDSVQINNQDNNNNHYYNNYQNIILREMFII